MKVPQILSAEQPKPERPKRVDLKFEKMIILCAIGCLEQGLPLSDKDYVRLHLAYSRLKGSK